MKRKIKNALAWLFGAAYASSWWMLVPMYRSGELSLLIIPLLGVVAGSCFLVVGVVVFFLECWDSDD